ncbi:MAG: zinc-ribbon domain-containing protein [Pseudomonadota bacterium]|uniref:zinc-ribbon domain-containing protein n=1 Tax=Roseovarius TaxID=74030 RepID=UPI0022A7BE06|nr:zinc-ribbon domain-containing protein [Roseovarius sp. EGI FJ00037]MCZ0811490.1 zinc-ribbon domain-containing protein [Roseovarius sp. EGI FJ00037]
MRLTCPNCGAQYEVPEEVIPAAGRDVQCSNCGDTWFQHHPDHIPESTVSDEPGDETATWESEAEYEAEPEPAPEPEPVAQPEPDLPEPEQPDTGEADGPTPPRREIDPAVRDLLREEAEREAQARAAESAGDLETQPDLGLDSQSPSKDLRGQEARARMARLRGEPEPSPTDPGPKEDIDPDSRRNLLPDIDEINSSLEHTPERDQDMSTTDAELARQAGGGGFRRGFLWAVLLFVILTLLYIFAPQIAGLSPALEGPMAIYVNTVNDLRILLQQTVLSFLQ